MNSSSSKTESARVYEDFKHDVLVISCIVWAVVGISTAVVNVILLLVIKADPYRYFNKPVVYVEICFLCTSLFGSVVLIPGYSLFDIYKGSFSHQDETIFKFILLFLTRMFIGNGNLTFILTAMEGSLGLTKPHLVRRLATRKNIKRLLLSFNLVSLIFCLLPLSGAGSFQMYMMIYIHLFVLAPLIFLMSVSGTVCYRLRYPVTVGHESQSRENKLGRQQHDVNKKRNKLITRNYIVSSALLFCPFVVVNLCYYFSKIFNIDFFVARCQKSRWCYVGERLVIFLVFLFPILNTIGLIFLIPIYKRSLVHYFPCRGQRVSNQ